jgi:hypothetical protein
MTRQTAVVLSTAIVLGILGVPATERPRAPAAAASVETVEWKDLVPPGYGADTLNRQYQKEAGRIEDWIKMHE